MRGRVAVQGILRFRASGSGRSDAGARANSPEFFRGRPLVVASALDEPRRSADDALDHARERNDPAAL